MSYLLVQTRNSLYIEGVTLVNHKVRIHILNTVILPGIWWVAFIPDKTDRKSGYTHLRSGTPSCH